MSRIVQVLKVAGAAVIVSIVLILSGALIAYKLRLSDAQMSLFAVAVYAVGAFIAGFGMGKIKKGRRLLWGVCRGCVFCDNCAYFHYIGNGTSCGCGKTCAVRGYMYCGGNSRRSVRVILR